MSPRPPHRHGPVHVRDIVEGPTTSTDGRASDHGGRPFVTTFYPMSEVMVLDTDSIPCARRRNALHVLGEDECVLGCDFVRPMLIHESVTRSCREQFF